MSEFITSEKLSEFIKNIIINAENFICIITRSLNMTDELFDLLKNASEREVKISILYGSNELESSHVLSIAEISNLKLYCIPDINSRCFYNEKEMVITSKDIYELNDNSKIDIGIIIVKESDASLYNNVIKEMNLLMEKADKIRKDFEEEVARIKSDMQKNHIYQGFCVICAMPVSFNPAQPICRSCSTGTTNWEHSEEIYCHSCCRKTAVVNSSPLCSDCSKN